MFKGKIKKKHIAPLAAILIILTLSLTVVRPIFTKTLFLRTARAKEREDLKLLAKKAVDLTNIEAKEAELQNAVKLAEKVFPSEKPVLNLLSSLSFLVNQEELDFSGIELQPGKIERESKIGSGATESVNLEFSVSGSLDKIGNFIKKLERTAPLIRVEGFRLELGEEKSRAALQLKVFYQSMPKNLGAIESALPSLTSNQENILGELEQFVLPEEVIANAPTGKEEIFNFAPLGLPASASPNGQPSSE